MCDHILSKIYSLYLNKGGNRVILIEAYLSYNHIYEISLDDERNQPYLYATLFSDECQVYIERLYLRLLSEMKGIPYEKCDNIIEALMFIQQISSTALWVYNCNASQKLETFVRDFDRLDVSSEKIRLYESVQRWEV